jgi:carbon monoxide dehydrogenase subunit G
VGMRIEKSFVVHAAPATVWAFLIDPVRVARCLPGAAITEQTGERSYAGTITVKVGPVSASYKGKVRFERLDEASREAEIVASGQDVRGKGGADMRMTSRVRERAPGETEVVAVSEVNVTGILAQLGRGMIQDVSDQMFHRFTDALRAELEAGEKEAAVAAAPADAGPGAAPPIEVVSFGTALVGRLGARALRRPTFWVVIAVLLVALVLVWLWLR